MQNKTNTSPQWTVADLYNMIMLDIEPDLTTSMLPMLDVLYADESETSRKDRLAWYNQALDIADERLQMVTDVWRDQVGQLKNEIMSMIQSDQDQKDETVLGQLESDIADT